jgi:signal transduction histidine kinase
VEALLIPWGAAGGPVGTLWIVAHNELRKFDREDVRLMNCMAAFVAGALRLKQTVVERERAAVSAYMVSQMAHHLNNPLQGAILALYSAQSGEMSPRVREMISLAEKELVRVTELSAAMLQQIYLPTA